jgi:hypothetical protein
MISPTELQSLKEFWLEEDKLNGSTSNATILIRLVEEQQVEIARLNEEKVRQEEAVSEAKRHIIMLQDKMHPLGNWAGQSGRVETITILSNKALQALDAATGWDLADPTTTLHD